MAKQALIFVMAVTACGEQDSGQVNAPADGDPPTTPPGVTAPSSISPSASESAMPTVDPAPLATPGSEPASPATPSASATTPPDNDPPPDDGLVMAMPGAIEESDPEPSPEPSIAPMSPTAPTTPAPSMPPDEPAPPPALECNPDELIADAAAFECGDAHVFEDNGPPSNRVNYVIVADGYVESELDTALVEHVENMLYNDATGMFAEIGEPYLRYRNFINVCAVRSVSNESGVDGPGDNPNRDTIFDGGNCGDRLGCVDDRLVRQYLTEALPEHIDVDWLAATMNENEWWNSGGSIMVWSGKYMESSDTRAASVAIHEGGHTFHQLADEYGDDNLNCNCNAAREPNVACESSSELTAESKWGEWFDFSMEGGGRLWNLGAHGAVPGGRYCGPGSGVTRPTQDSEMNLLPYAYNMPSMQKAIHDIYRIVQPIDAHTPNQAPVDGEPALVVRVVDPAVITLEWSVDGEVVPASGACFDLSQLESGEHTVSARAFDETPWVRDTREDLEQTVEWTVIVP